jgi:hypothetical protein
LSDSLCSIVAIHGIGAHPEQTWTDKDYDNPAVYINWLTDPRMLPSVLPTARILRFGYKSQWFGDPIVSTLTTIGDRFSIELERTREVSMLLSCSHMILTEVPGLSGSANNLHCTLFWWSCRSPSKNPRTFPTSGPSIDYWQALQHRFRHDIFQATAGIAFLGTPFRGTHKWFHKELPKLAKDQHRNVRDNILQTLHPKNSTLKDLRDTFSQMRDSDDRPGMPQVACFFEEKPSKVGKILGDPETEDVSITLGNADDCILMIKRLLLLTIARLVWILRSRSGNMRFKETIFH